VLLTPYVPHGITGIDYDDDDGGSGGGGGGGGDDDDDDDDDELTIFGCI
jgi:hypothetical protein